MSKATATTLDAYLMLTDHVHLFVVRAELYQQPQHGSIVLAGLQAKDG